MFEGALTALITPFKDGRVDTAALEAIVEEQIAAGIKGLVPCGTTGESPTLSHAEHIHVVEAVMKAAGGRVPVLAGAGSNSTREAIELARACKELGVSATLQITPYYNKPTQEGLAAHFKAIAEAVELPIIVYNVPGRTSVDLLPETLGELSKHPLIRGVKEATGDLERAVDVRELCEPDFCMLSGHDQSLLPFLSVGGDGVISVGSNPAPALFAKLCDAARDGRWQEARELHFKQMSLTRALFSVSSPIPVKAAMTILGKCQPEMRLPLVMLEQNGPQWAAIERELRNLELLQ